MPSAMRGCWLGGGRRAVGDPTVEVDEGGAQEGAVLEAVEGVGASVAVDGVNVGQRQAAEGVLGAGEGVDADWLGRVDVVGAVEVGVDEGAVAGPVLGRRVGIHDLRQIALGGEAGQQAVGQAGVGVGLGLIGEGEQAVDAAGGLAGGLGETLVELAALTSGDVGDDAVEHGAARLVVVDAVVQEGAQVAAALGDAEGVGVVDGDAPPP